MDDYYNEKQKPHCESDQYYTVIEILTWVGIIFVNILHRAKVRCKILTNIMPNHVKISIEPDIREFFLK
jgi:hypothetical protein